MLRFHCIENRRRQFWAYLYSNISGLLYVIMGVLSPGACHDSSASVVKDMAVDLSGNTFYEPYMCNAL